MATSDNAPAIDLQALLRFLTRDAALPLSEAMTRIIPALRKTSLVSPAAIAASNLDALRTALGDAGTGAKDSKGRDIDVPKVLHNAAKRVEKKKQKPGGDQLEDASPRGKKRKASPGAAADEQSGAELEASLKLPWPTDEEGSEEKLRETVFVTNRAPLVLAFAVQLLKFTMPEQPLSSRLSLAQALVSVNSASKARSLGIAEGKGAEEEGWGKGQPAVKVMGREVRVLKRWGYEWRDGDAAKAPDERQDEQGADGNVKQESRDGDSQSSIEEPALWGLDLEALKKSNGPALPDVKSQSRASLPIYTPQAARGYIVKAFASKKEEGGAEKGSKAAKKEAEEKEKNLGLLLKALDMLFQSWADTLDKAELDRRAWQWYVRTRPEVAHGVAGWGGKGEVKLAEILDLRR